MQQVFAIKKLGLDDVIPEFIEIKIEKCSDIHSFVVLSSLQIAYRFQDNSNIIKVIVSFIKAHKQFVLFSYKNRAYEFIIYFFFLL